MGGDRTEYSSTLDTVPEHPAERAQLVPLLASITKSTRALLGLKLARVGLVIGQDQLLSVLASRKGRHLTEVADELLVRPSTISKMIDPLQRAGLCVRTRSGEDMRKIVLVLTPEGERAAAQVQSIAAELDREIGRSVAEAKLAGVRDDLQEIADALTARLSRLR